MAKFIIIKTLPEDVVPMMTKYLQEWTSYAIVWSDVIDDAYVFPGDGIPIDDKRIREILKQTYVTVEGII